MYAVIYVIGVFQPKQIKTCAIVCRPFEILCEAAENLACARKLFLYNLLCMTHHIIFVNSVWENYKSGVDFAPGRHFGESQPKKLNRGQRKFKHFTTASEIKSYREHPQKHKPQEMITQYACNKPASWPLNVRLSAAKTRFRQSKFRMLHALCSTRKLRAREKRRKTSVQADSQSKVAFRVITSLWCCTSSNLNFCFVSFWFSCLHISSSSYSFFNDSFVLFFN